MFEEAGTPKDEDEGVAADTNGTAHSNDEEKEVDEDSSSPASRGDLARDTPFPQQLMHAIDHEMTVDGFMGDDGERVLEWGEDGTSFVVRHKAIFESHVLPRHFNVKCK